jgi:hypothetical protein
MNWFMPTLLMNVSLLLVSLSVGNSSQGERASAFVLVNSGKSGITGGWLE